MNLHLGSRLANLAALATMAVAIILIATPQSAGGRSCGSLWNIDSRWGHSAACQSVINGRSTLVIVLIALSITMWIAAVMIRRHANQAYEDSVEDEADESTGNSDQRETP